MDIISLITQTWPQWRVVQPLGTGTYGSVFMAERSDSIGRTWSAVKVVSTANARIKRPRIIITKELHILYLRYQKIWPSCLSKRQMR